MEIAHFTPSEFELKILKYLYDRLGPQTKIALFQAAGLRLKSRKDQRTFEIIVNRLVEEFEVVAELTPDFSYCITQKGRKYMYESS